MKNLLPAIVLVSTLLGSSACKKSTVCTFSEDGVEESFVFAEGDLITVTSNNTITYRGASFAQGDTFTITYDTAHFNNGLQFQGVGTVKRTLTDKFCGGGKTHKEQLDQHNKNGWSCEDAEENCK